MKHAKHAILLTAFSLTTVCYAQTHQPTHTVNGREITVDAEIANITPNPERLVSGTMLTNDSMVFSLVGEPIVWTLNPGTYRLRMMGYADDPEHPNRSVVELDIVVELTRKEAICDAYDRLYQAMVEIRALAPTYYEFAEAVSDQELDGNGTDD